MVDAVSRFGRVYALSSQPFGVWSAPVQSGSDKLRKYSNKGVGVMAAAGEVTRLSPTPIQRSIIILKGLSMSIDENNNYDDGNGDD